MSAIDVVEKAQLTERPQMKSGDTVKVHRERPAPMGVSSDCRL